MYMFAALNVMAESCVVPQLMCRPIEPGADSLRRESAFAGLENINFELPRENCLLETPRSGEDWFKPVARMRSMMSSVFNQEARCHLWDFTISLIVYTALEAFECKSFEH